MARNTEIISVSIPKEMAEYVDFAKLSPSQLLQERIIEEKEKRSEINKAHELANQYKLISARNIQAFSDFLKQKDIPYEEFMRFKEVAEKNGSHQLV